MANDLFASSHYLNQCHFSLIEPMAANFSEIWIKNTTIFIQENLIGKCPRLNGSYFASASMFQACYFRIFVALYSSMCSSFFVFNTSKSCVQSLSSQISLRWVSRCFKHSRFQSIFGIYPFLRKADSLGNLWGRLEPEVGDYVVFEIKMIHRRFYSLKSVSWID